MSLNTIPLGSQGLTVSCQGLGCMGMTAFYGGGFNRRAADKSNLETLDKALELGVTFLDTAWIYQSFGADGEENYTNEEVVGKALEKYGRDKFVVATKFGITTTGPSGKETTIREQLADSLKRLGTDYIDLYYMHRMDPDTPIEETMGVLKSLVEAGTIKYIGLSECTPEEIRRAHAIHPISAVQMEYSLWARDIEVDVLPTCQELGIGVVAYSPLGRGVLTNAIKSRDALSEKDWRLATPRFQEGVLEENLQTLQPFFQFAEKKGCSPGQLALAWVQAKGCVAIPGTKSATRLAENVGAASVLLSGDEMKVIDGLIGEIKGRRYPDGMAQYNDRL